MNLPKLYTLIVLFILSSLEVSSQTLPGNFNLVPNPSFEFTTDPNYTVYNDTDFVTSKTCWVKANNQKLFIAPAYNMAYNGKKYAILRDCAGWASIPPLKWSDTLGDSRNYYQAKLYEPLVAGTTYYFTMYAGNYIDSAKNYGFNILNVADIGVRFSSQKDEDYNTYGRMNLTPQILFTNWTVPANSYTYAKLTASYKAKGGEQYITIGNFSYFSDFTYQYIRPITQPGMSIIVWGYFESKFFDAVSLVQDTTQAMISLDSFSLGPDTVICPGQTLTIGGQPHFFHYWWNTGDTTRTINITQTGTYWCTADFGCNTYTDTLVVSAPVVIPAFNIPDTSLCIGISDTLHAPGNFPNYLWSTGSTTPSASIATSGMHWLKITNQCNVGYTDSFFVTNINTPVTPFDIHDTAFCTPQGYTLKAPAGSSHYLWSTGDTTSYTAAHGFNSYWIRAYNDCAVQYTDTVHVNNLDTPIPPFDIADITICHDEQHLFNSPTGYPRYLWSNGDSALSITLSQEGVYWLTVMNTCNRSYTDSFSIIDLNTLITVPQLGNDTMNCLYDMPVPVRLSARLLDVSNNIRWSTGHTGTDITVTAPGRYWVEVSNKCVSYTDTIELLGCPAKEIEHIWLPSAFSPNGDGLNDLFRIPYPPSQISSVKLEVYNRFGQRVYRLTNVNDGWDGKGCDVGAYYYYLQYTDVAGKKHLQKGDVTLVR